MRRQVDLESQVEIALCTSTYDRREIKIETGPFASSLTIALGSLISPRTARTRASVLLKPCRSLSNTTSSSTRSGPSSPRKIPCCRIWRAEQPTQKARTACDNCANGRSPLISVQSTVGAYSNEYLCVQHAWEFAMTKVALVTGGGSGTGRAVTLGLAKAGYAVVLCGRRSGPLEEVAREAGPLSLALVADVTNPESVHALFAKVATNFGRLDLLFNNAGINAAATLEGLTLRTPGTGGRYEPHRRIPFVLRQHSA